MNTLQLSVAKGSMYHLAEGGASGNIENLGITPSDMEILTGSLPWTGNQRSLITRILETLMFGALDTAGLTHFELSAEYVAAAISMFVHPTNTMVCSRWLERNYSAQQLSNPNTDTGQIESITATQIFHLVLQLQNDGFACTCRKQFENRTKIKIMKNLIKPLENQTESTKSK